MAQQLRLKLGRSDAPSMDEFVLGPSNREAVAALGTWPRWHGGVLTLVGPAGSGKSHLGQAWAQTTSAAIHDREVPDIATVPGQPVLLEGADQGVSDESLFHLINLASRTGGGLLLTARNPPLTWPAVLPDLGSRLKALTVVELGLPDDTVLEGVLRRFFRDRHIRPPEEIYAYLLRRMERSIPDAEGIVRQLDEAGEGELKPVTRWLARKILKGGE